MPNLPNQESEDKIMPWEAAKMLGVTTKTLIHMALRGEIECVLLPSGHRRYYRAQVEALLKGQAA